MARTFWGQGPDEGDETARRPGSPNETGPEVPKALKGSQDSQEPNGPLTSPDVVGAAPEKETPGGPTVAPRPTRTTPGGGGLAAILIQNRTKTGKQKIMEGEGAIPERTRSPTGSFELMEVTAVGGAPVSGSKTDSKTDPKFDSKTPAIETGPGTPGGRAAATFPVRASYPTPGGGLPGLLMRTQLGLGDSARAAIDENGREHPPATLAPLRSTSTGATGLEGGDTTSLASAEAAEGDGQTTDVVPFVASTEAASVAAESAPLSELSSPSSSASVPIVDAGSGPDAVAGPATGAVVAAPEGPSGPANEFSSGAVVLPSGPVFELATGQVGQVGDSGAASGPVFDLVSGPITGVGGSSPEVTSVGSAGGESSGPSETLAASGVSRPTGPSPTNGRLAALLAESRKRSGRHETVEKTGPTALGSGSAASSGPTDAGANDVATVRVPGASMAEKRGPGFAATLLGLPGPEQQAIEAALASVRGGAAARGGSGPVHNSPLPVEGEETERSLLSTDDVRRGWQRPSGEEKRITEIIDVVAPARRAGIKAAVVIAGGLLAIGGVIFLGSLRKPKHSPSPPVPALGARLAVPAPEETPPPVRGSQGEEPTRTADEPAQAGGSPVATPPTEEAAPTAGVGERDHAPVGVDSARGSPASTRDAVTTGEGEGDGKRNVAQAGTRRPDPGRSEPKARRRAAEGHGARAAGATTGAPAASAEPARARLAQPSRTPELDPDATLPLGIR